MHLCTIHKRNQMDKKIDNNEALRKLWESTGLSQAEALALVNKKQLRPIALSTWKAYMAGPEVARRRECPTEILSHAKKVLEKVKKGA